MNKIRLIKEQHGTAIVLFSVLITLMIGMAGLVIDMGVAYSAKSHLKKAANAAVLSGAQELTNGKGAVKGVIREVLRAHGEEGSLIKEYIDRFSGGEFLNEVLYSYYNNGNFIETYINKISEHNLKIILQKDIPTKFLRLFKINTIRVKESSAAKLLPMSRASGAVPLGIDESIPIEYMQEYTLKVDSGDSEYGYFGILALSGPGAKLYEQDLMYGFDGEIKIGDIIDTQTGNISGKTRDAVNYRINNSPYPEGDMTHRDDPRVMLVLVYKPYNVQGNQMKQVKVTGFAYFYLKEPMDSHDSSITGYFIERAGTGFGENDIPKKGAYAIKMTE